VDETLFEIDVHLQQRDLHLPDILVPAFPILFVFSASQSIKGELAPKLVARCSAYSGDSLGRNYCCFRGKRDLKNLLSAIQPHARAAYFFLIAADVAIAAATLQDVSGQFVFPGMSITGGEMLGGEEGSTSRRNRHSSIRRLHTLSC
jgi:hypothetical protein